MSSPPTPDASRAATPPLTEAEKEIVHAALAEDVRRIDGRYEVRRDGQWHADNGTVEAMAARGLLVSGGEAVRVTDDGKEGAGLLTIRLILSLEVGQAADRLVVAERYWHGPPEGPAAMVVLTADGGVLDNRDWCHCEPNVDDMAPFERWTAEGRRAYGSLHSACRRR